MLTNTRVPRLMGWPPILRGEKRADKTHNRREEVKTCSQSGERNLSCDHVSVEEARIGRCMGDWRSYLLSVMAVCGISTGLTGRILIPSLMTQSRYVRRTRSDTRTVRSPPTCSSSSFCTCSCTCRRRGTKGLNLTNGLSQVAVSVSLPVGGAGGRPGSTAAWSMWSQLQHQRLQLLS